MNGVRLLSVVRYGHGPELYEYACGDEAAAVRLARSLYNDPGSAGHDVTNVVVGPSGSRLVTPDELAPVPGENYSPDEENEEDDE